MGKFLLPDGETLVTDLKCAVVVYPDDDRYRRALWGQISALTKYWMWEPDGNGGEYDAADSWDEAYDATLENFGMLDTIIDHIDEVEDLLRLLTSLAKEGDAVACCAEQDPSNGDLYTEDVTDGTGTVPQNIVDAGFVADANDWTGFQDYKCMIAHVVLDDMVGKLRTLDALVDAAGIIAGGIAAIVAIVTAIFSGGLSVMATGLLMTLGASATLYKWLFEGGDADGLADKVEANRQALVCKFMDGDGPQASYDALIAEAATLFTSSEMLVLRNLNSGPVSKALYGARYEQDDMAQRLLDAGYTDPTGFNCDCAALFNEYTNFGTDFEGRGNWTGGNLITNSIHISSGASPGPIARDGVLTADTVPAGTRVQLIVEARWDAAPMDLILEVRRSDNNFVLATDTFTLTESPATYSLDDNIASSVDGGLKFRVLVSGAGSFDVTRIYDAEIIVG